MGREESFRIVGYCMGRVVPRSSNIPTFCLDFPHIQGPQVVGSDSKSFNCPVFKASAREREARPRHPPHTGVPSPRCSSGKHEIAILAHAPPHLDPGGLSRYSNAGELLTSYRGDMSSHEPTLFLPQAPVSGKRMSLDLYLGIWQESRGSPEVLSL